MNNQSLPLVTIAIPCYNAENTIERCIQSALNQGYPFLEIIVSDDNSQDNTKEKLTQFKDDRLQIFFQKENIGMNNNFRYCLSKTNGALITFLNNDDFLLPNSISKRVKQYQKTNNCLIVCSNAVWQGYRTGAFTFPFRGETTGLDVIYWSIKHATNKIHWSTTLFDTKKARDIGLSDNTFFDWVLWLRLLLQGNIGHVEEPLTILLDHENRVTKQRMKLKSKHCAELCLVLEEFAEKENLSTELQKNIMQGKSKLIKRYLLFSIDEYMETKDKNKLKSEILNFYKLSSRLQDRIMAFFILNHPILTNKLRILRQKIKKYFL